MCVKPTSALSTVDVNCGFDLQIFRMRSFRSESLRFGFLTAFKTCCNVSLASGSDCVPFLSGPPLEWLEAKIFLLLGPAMGMFTGFGC